MTGLESVINADELGSEDTFNRLKGVKSNRLGQTLHMLTLRARLNTHRHYEIYSINVDSEIDEDDIRLMFEDNPQGSADMIRERGIGIYSDRISKKVQVIS
jgi:hypothetical protein